MTRINLISPKELSDQNLLAEYRELPRCIKGTYKMNDAPERYTLGRGHVKWAAKYPGFLIDRYDLLLSELHFRGFKINYNLAMLLACAYNKNLDLTLNYDPNYRDIFISRQRIIEKYKENPSVHTWTKRNKPPYLGDENENY